MKKSKQQYERIPKCITCENYAWWDEDDVCVETMQIVDINVDKSNCKAYRLRKNKKLLQIYIDAYENKRAKTSVATKKE